MADGGGGGGGGGGEEEDGTVLPDTPWSAISEGEMDARVEALMREREALQSAAREVAAAREGLHALGQDDPLRGCGRMVRRRRLWRGGTRSSWRRRAHERWGR